MRAFGVVAFAWMVCACSATDDRAPGAATFSEGLVLAESAFGLESDLGAASFNFSHVRDLWVRVKLSHLSGPSQLDLTLIDPAGTILYEATAEFSPDPNMATMPMPGAARPVTVFPAKQLRGGFALDYAVPISGSVVTRYMTPGTWQIRVQAAGRNFSRSIQVSTTP